MIRIKQRNKVLLTILIILSAITALVITVTESSKAAVRRKLSGCWNIEVENSGWNRDKEYDIGTIIYVQSKGTIELPCVYEDFGIDFKGKTLLDDDVFDDNDILTKYRTHSYEMSQKAKGCWEIVSTNPDSVFFNVPQNPLHGKYAIRFFIDESGWASMNMTHNIFKMELKNDSTLLICNKGGAMRKNGLRNWDSK